MPFFLGCISRRKVKEDEKPLIVSDKENESETAVEANKESKEEKEKKDSAVEKKCLKCDIFTKEEWNELRFRGTRSSQVIAFKNAVDSAFALFYMKEQELENHKAEIVAAGSSIPIERVEEWKEKEDKAEMAVIEAKYLARLLESSIPRLIEDCKSFHLRLQEALEKMEDEMIKEKISYWKAVFHDKIKKNTNALLL